MRKHAGILSGEVCAELIGGDRERLLNACAAGGLCLWDVTEEKDCVLRARLEESELSRLERIATMCRFEIKVLELRGGSRSKKLLKQRARLGVFAAILALALAVSSLFIWEIEVMGNERMSRGEILRALSECGVSEGCFWPAADAERVRAEMLIRCNDLAWMTLNVRGSRATVLVLERKDKPEIYLESAAADLVASRDGVVRELSVKNGKTVVSPGEIVAKGQTLVSSAMDSPTGETRRVRALGSVTADTWPEKVVFLSPGAQRKEREDGLRLALGLKFGKSRLELAAKSRKELDECDKIVKEYKLDIDGLFRFPLSLVVETYRPYRPAGEAECDASSARERAIAALEEEIDGEVASCDFTAEKDRIVLRAHCVENIAVTEES